MGGKGENGNFEKRKSLYFVQSGLVELTEVVLESFENACLLLALVSSCFGALGLALWVVSSQLLNLRFFCHFGLCVLSVLGPCFLSVPAFSRFLLLLSICLLK